MAAMIARTGRQNQLYHNCCRHIAGCIPYRFDGEKMEVLVVKAQKSDSVLFPKGGWENDETVKEAALREAMEEAGVEGIIGEMIGVWTFSSKGHEDADHIAHVFPVRSPKLHDCWPEMHRERLWMRAEDARKRVKHQWMREALDKFMNDMGFNVDNGYPVPNGFSGGLSAAKAKPLVGLMFMDKRKRTVQHNLEKQMPINVIDRFFYHRFAHRGRISPIDRLAS